MGDKQLKLEYTVGCMSNHISVNDKLLKDVSNEELESILLRITRKNPDLYDELFRIILQSEGDYEDLGTCDQCGDLIEHYTLVI